MDANLKRTRGLRSTCSALLALAALHATAARELHGQAPETAGQNRSGASPQALPLPAVQASVAGAGASLAAAVSTGGATYAVPFVLPPGRGGVAPKLGLSYTSGGGQGPVGLGFALGVATIERDTDRGVPGYADAPRWHPEEDRFAYGGRELVPVDASEMAAVDGAAAPAELAGFQQYRARVEGGFMRFFRAPDGLRWVVQEPDGSRHEFGAIAEGPSELTAPALFSGSALAGEDVSGSGAALTADAGRVFRWWLTRTSDPHGSTIYYRYTQSERQVYLSDVHYVSPPSCAGSPAAALRCAAPLASYAVRVGFVYEPRTDPWSSHRAGFRVRTALRLRRVEITSAAEGPGERFLVRRYHLRYDERSHHSLLRSVQLEGRPEAIDPNVSAMVADARFPERALGDAFVGALLPAQRFGYTGDALLAAGSHGFPALDDTLHESPASPDVSVKDPLADLFDVNRDGLPDVIVTDPAAHRTEDGGPAVGVYFNGFAGTAATPAMPGSFSAAVPAAVRDEDAAALRLTNPNLLPFEVDGDGGSEFLHMPKRQGYDYFVASRAPASAGVRPSAQQYRWAHVPVALPDGAVDPAIDLRESSRIRVLDVNGDGLADLVRTASDRLQTWLNLGFHPEGDGRFGSAHFEGDGFELTTAPIERCLPATPGAPLDFTDPAVLIADLDGDGLSDIARMTQSRLVYWPSRGNGYFGTGDRACAQGVQSAIHVQVESPPAYPQGAERKLVLADADADGLADLLFLGDGFVGVWFNCGGERFTPRVVLRNAPRVADVEQLVRAVDIDGSGTVDLLFARAGRWQWLDPAGGMRPRLLRAIDNGLGASTEVEYASSASDYLRDLAAADACSEPGCERFAWTHVRDECDARIDELTGECVRPPAGSPLLPTVVRAITTRDGFERLGLPANATRVEYAYHDAYYEGIEREFRGFAASDEIAIGDAQHPGSTTRRFMFVAARPTALASDRLAANPYEALHALGYLSETHDADGIYLASIHSGFTVRRLALGLDGRPIELAFERRRDELRYDTTGFEPAAQGRMLEDPLEGGAGLEAVRFERAQGGGAGPDPERPAERRGVRLRSERHAHLVTRKEDVDNAGHVQTTVAHGRVRGEFGEPLADERIVSRTPWALHGRADRWQWKPVRSFVQAAGGAERLNEVEWQYDAEGDLQLVRKRLVAAPTHEFAGDDRGALGFTPALDHPLISLLDDAWGQTTAVCVGADVRGGPSAGCLRHSTTAYDPAYGQLPVEQRVATGQRGGELVFLTTRVEDLDRGLGVALTQRDANGALTESGVDGLGRPTWFRLPALPACGGSAPPSKRLRYALTDDPQQRPVNMVESVEERACEAGADSAITRTFSDGLGRTRAVLIAAEAPHAWQRSGVALFDACGSVAQSFQPDFLDAAEPPLPALLGAPSTPSERMTHDAFGRAHCTRHADGESLTCNSYHALSRDACDPNDNRAGTPFHRTCTTTREDGHGRTVDTISRNVAPDGSAEVYRLWPSYRADGALVTLMRAQTQSDGPRELSAPIAGRSAARSFAYDSLGRRIAASDADADARRSGTDARNRSWRYLYNRADDVVAIRDPRGCGRNRFFDLAGRTLGEQYVGCAAAQRAEPRLASVPAGSIALGPLTAETAVDARTYHDAYPPWAQDELLPPADAAGALGRVTAGLDRAQRSVAAYDARGNPIWSARQMALISAAPQVADSSADPPALAGGPALGEVGYDEQNTYVVETRFDHANRVREVDYPTDPDYGSSATAPQVTGEVAYNRRGLLGAAQIRIDGVAQPVIAEVAYAADGLGEETVYGDGADGRPATTARTFYDARRRPVRAEVMRAPTAAPSQARSLAAVGQVVEHEYDWDPASNLIAIRDLRPASEHADGARPQSVSIGHDALYRVVEVGYAYAQDGGGSAPDRAIDWRGVADRSLDPMAEEPAPALPDLPEARAMSMTWTHDWLGNTVDWDDDAGAFHERSLGVISHGIEEPGGRPSALRFASNLPDRAPAQGAIDRGGYLEVRYTEGGDVESVRVHAQCFDAGAARCWGDRAQPIAQRATVLSQRCACGVEQHYQYGWDELNRITEARRYDRTGGAWQLAARLRYRYDAANQRLIKQALTRADERIALHPIPGDFERRGLVRGAEGYESAAGGTAETQYLIAGARLVWQAAPAIAGLDPDHRISTAIADLLGTTQAVIELRSGELLELSTYYPNGARESLRVSEPVEVPLEPAGFTGKESDAAVGLTYFGERYLLAHLGRWASPDPLQLHDAGGGQALNNYHYVSANLLQARDPIGLDQETLKDTILDADPPAGWQWRAELANQNHDHGAAEFALYDDRGDYTGKKVEGHYYKGLGFGLARTDGQYYAASVGKRWQRISESDYGRLEYVAGCMSRPQCMENWSLTDKIGGTLNSIATLYVLAAGMVVPSVGLAVGGVEVIDSCKGGLSWGCGGAVAMIGFDIAGAGLGRMGNGGAPRGPAPFAMGIDKHLDGFALQHGATTWKDFDDLLDWKSKVLDVLADPERRVLFNLDDVEVWPGVQRAASGRGGATDWELLQLRNNPDWPRVEFWKNGKSVDNPFK